MNLTKKEVTHPTGNKTLGPMQKKLSTIRNTKTICILLIYLRLLSPPDREMSEYSRTN